MKKLASLRTALLASVPSLGNDPARLEIYVERGDVRLRPGNLSFEYRYTASVWVQDFVGDVADLHVPLLGWIADNQPDLFEKGDSRPFTFECEILDADTSDVMMTLELTELVRVGRVEGGLSVEHLPEPVMVDRFNGIDPAPLLWRGLLDDQVAGPTGEVPA